ncbi:MAG: ATP-dependent Clp protease adaptor ClpS [Bacteroidales bacterium]|nr:ATP-dependent Clp protease adaptor ClpS [Bacteroidales bacterium]
MTKEKIQPVEKKQGSLENPKELVLFNDEVNTFDYVIETLIDVCGHEPEQAEQCAMIAHYNGRCTVKSGAYTELKPPYDEMTNRKLTVSIY